MGNIVKFKPNMDYYYTRGLNQYESDNFVDAIKSYREAYRFVEGSSEAEFRSILEVEMACCYRSLSLIRETQLMYYKSLSDCNLDASFDSIIGLIDLFGTSGNEEALKYYMDLAAKKGFSRELDYIDAATQFYSQREFRAEPPPEQNLLELGKKLLEAGQFEFARQLLEVVPPESSVYGSACSKLAALYNGCGEHEKALECAEIASKDGETAENLINKVLALYRLGRDEEYNEALTELGEFEINDIGALSNMVRAMAIVGNADLVIKYGKRLSGISPLRSPMLCYAVALADKGELREARKVMVTLQALYPYDAIILTYANLISNLSGAADFPLTCELPAQVESGILENLNGVLSECGNDRNRLKQKLRDSDLRTGILMIFQAGSDNSKRILCDIVADIPFFERYIRDCLMDPGFPDSDKRIMLPIALKRFKKRPVFLTCRDICRPLYGKPPAKSNAKWREAYYLAFSTVALFGCENFEKEFDAVFVRLHASLSGETNPDEVALAAVLAHRTKRVNALCDDECCIEIFGADRETYFKYSGKQNKTKTKEKIGGKENV